MSQQQFAATLATVTAQLAGRPVDTNLQSLLNEQFGPISTTFRTLARLCQEGIEAGWLCNREHGGIKFGRVIKPGIETHEFSVDVVEMENVAGPWHAHPRGEIDMIVSLNDDARFDGHTNGWLVYEAGSQHAPTVTGGKAIILYLLPAGEIDFKVTAPIS
jgi:hypothetical protein